MLRTLNRWFETHRWAADAVIASVLLVALTTASVSPTFPGPRSVVLTFLLVLPLYLRRTAPLATLLATVALCLVQLAVAPFPVPGDAVVPIVVHAAAAYIPDRRWGVAALGAGIVGSGAAALEWTWFQLGRFRYADLVGEVVYLTLAGSAGVVAAFLIALRQREKRSRAEEQLAALAERNRLLTAERDSRIGMAAAAERARIARELHDIVAHSLSVIVVQADGGAAAARSKPELGPQVLETIATTSRGALAQMRRMVSVLRDGDDVDPRFAPAPGPADLGLLVDQVQDAGLPVQFDVIGAAREMSSDAGLAVYRVVQESLTNVLKHAGPAASCRVVVHYGARETLVTVTDDGRGAAAEFTETDSDPGHGLSGMHERVELLGGSVHAGPLVGGGFEVTASIPYGDVGSADAVRPGQGSAGDSGSAGSVDGNDGMRGAAGAGSGGGRGGAGSGGGRGGAGDAGRRSGDGDLGSLRGTGSAGGVDGNDGMPGAGVVGRARGLGDAGTAHGRDEAGSAGGARPPDDAGRSNGATDPADVTGDEAQ